MVAPALLAAAPIVTPPVVFAGAVMFPVADSVPVIARPVEENKPRCVPATFISAPEEDAAIENTPLLLVNEQTVVEDPMKSIQRFPTAAA